VKILEDQTMNDTIKIKLQHSKPVELSDFSLAFMAIAREFSQFSNSSEFGVPQSKLYISTIERGSIVADLLAIASQGTVFTDQANSIVEFGASLKSFFSYFKGETEEKPEFDKRKLDNLHDFLEPVAKDHQANWIIIAGDNNTLMINSQEANAIQNSMTRERKLLSEPVAGEHRQVALIFKQTRNDPGVGNKAVIESISKNLVRTVFAEGLDFEGTLLGDSNPLTGVYSLDVRVETVDDKPVLYKILRVHGRLDD